jgi:hypothetical protein
MANPAHTYRIRDAAGTTVMRVGHANRQKAYKLAQDWAASLTASTGQPHTAQKVRNTRNSGVGY